MLVRNQYRRSLLGSCRKAFTMIEVMAVVVILAGLWVLILPSMGARDDLRAGAAARTVIADLIYAQNRAISTQTTQYVSFTLSSGYNNGGYTIYDGQPFATPITNPVTQGTYAVTFGVGAASQFNTVTVSGVNLGTPGYTVLAFNEMGQPMGGTTSTAPVALTTAGTVTLTSGAQSVTLSIEPDTGNITTP
jgi:prepilin-type N-terminal cleavage/methylation domain-containing protein